ncbi:MAG: DUF2062 domain-containing protein [Planctomycetaceae bacterium]|nr:MAG: DUF2062 domain-containing protein [Planctomycetaceae bacterium]
MPSPDGHQKGNGKNLLRAAMNPKKRVKDFYTQFISLKGHPRELAAGVAIGVFIGVTPTIPFHTLMIIVFSVLLRKNITAGILGSAIVSNPFTIPFFYTVEYYLGKLFVDGNQYQFTLNDYAVYNIINMGRNVACPLLIGGIILAPLFAIPAYFITHRALLAVRKKYGN